MKRSKMLILIIVVLLIANIATLAMLYNADKKPMQRSGSRMKEYLMKEVGFDQKQMDIYDSTYKLHQDIMKGLMKDSRKGINEVYQQLTVDGFTDSALDVAAQKLSNKQLEAQRMMLKHLGDVRSICNAQQVQHFDTTLYKMFQKRSRKGKQRD
ncbi:MAG TPA: hypothetical protein PKY29_03240 [Ferruginibacter sp.]|nr:periplasmic heavy metal sensor [Ferruginibacter sp.]HRN80297.1 hypothetical protein [Ferruginibacter sp.]HRO16762.1 hypothetical protein [Ferruginibacter sp.]HRQ20298.1 hypothetical protein [Ferruginibacter sp.]